MQPFGLPRRRRNAKTGGAYEAHSVVPRPRTPRHQTGIRQHDRFGSEAPYSAFAVEGAGGIIGGVEVAQRTAQGCEAAAETPAVVTHAGPATVGHGVFGRAGAGEPGPLLVVCRLRSVHDWKRGKEGRVRPRELIAPPSDHGGCRPGTGAEPRWPISRSPVRAGRPWPDTFHRPAATSSRLCPHRRNRFQV